MKKVFSGLCILLAAAFLAACSGLRFQSSTPTATYPAPLTTEPVFPTNTPLPTSTPTPHPTATPYQPIEGKIVFDNLMLRKGPGFLFKAVATYPIDQAVHLLGRAPGNNWLYVQTLDNLTGWMKVEGIELNGNIYDAPEVTPENAVIVHGRVFAPNGSPASEIGLMVNPVGAGTDTSKQDVGVSDVTGRFYIYLPAGTSGDWTLVANAWGCKGSNVDRNCNLYGKFPPEQVITLPQAADSEIEVKMLNY
jgi:hypothetical protein